MRTLLYRLPVALIALFLSFAAFAGEMPASGMPCMMDTLPKAADTSLHEASIDGKIFSKVEKEAEFPGGLEGWRSFLEKRLKADTPIKNKAPEGQYKVVVQFIVDQEGNVSDMKALTQHGYGMEEELLRVLGKSPKWIPAEQDGHKVKAYRRQPITFFVSKK